MRTPPQPPLARLKRDVRERVEEHIGCALHELSARRLQAIQGELAALRQHYRNRPARSWAYGETDARLVAYSLGYYPYHVELVAEALAAIPDIRARHAWDLRSRHPARNGQSATRHALVGCGAAPELYGLLRYIANGLWRSDRRSSVTPDLEITLYEPEHAKWKPIAEALTKPLIHRSGWLDGNLRRGAIRINWSPRIERVPRIQLPGVYDFLLVQLVLNEIDRCDWQPWLAKARDEHLAPGGMICVIDTDPSINHEIAHMGGFQRSVDLHLRWGPTQDRKLDAATTACLFPDAPTANARTKPTEHEKLGMRATASFIENPGHAANAKAVPKLRRPPRRTTPATGHQQAWRRCVHCGAPIPRTDGSLYCARHAGSASR